MDELLLFLGFWFFILPSLYCCSASWRDLAAAIKVQNSIQLDQERVTDRGRERGRHKGGGEGKSGRNREGEGEREAENEELVKALTSNGNKRKASTR